MLSLLAEGGVPAPPPPHNNFGDTMSDGLAGPVALLLIVLLAIATVFLIRNMNGRLRRLPTEFPAPAASRGAVGAGVGTDASAPSGQRPSDGGDHASGAGPNDRANRPNIPT